MHIIICRKKSRILQHFFTKLIYTFFLNKKGSISLEAVSISPEAQKENLDHKTEGDSISTQTKDESE